MMKVIRWTLAICIIVILVSMSSVAMTKVQDVEGHWAEGSFNMWIEKGLIKGFPDGTYKPEHPMTRAEFFVLLNRALNLHKASIGDITSNEWFSLDLSIAKEQGYLEGLPEEILEVREYISRQEAVSILGRAMQLSPEKSVASKYKDEDLIAVWARDYISEATKRGYIQGYANNTFGPENNIIRAEVVTILHRAIGELYNIEGTYGPISGTGTISGNSTISKSNVTLRNLTIEGDLYITEGVGDGTVTLDGVTVLGATHISGGSKGVFIKDSTIGEVVIDKTNTKKIHLIARGKTKIGTVHIQNNAKLEEEGLTGAGFRDIVLEAPEGVDLILGGDFNKVELKASLSRLSILKGSYIKLLETNAKDAAINIDKSVEIDTLTVNNSMKQTGKCTIRTANINASNVLIEGITEEVNKASGLQNVIIPKPAAPSTSGGEGGGGTGGSGGGNNGGGRKTGDIIEVKGIGDITVAYGTRIEEIEFPNKVEVTLDDSTTKNIAVAWDNGTPPYDETTAGTYEFAGTLTLAEGIKNTDGLKAKVNIVVAAERVSVEKVDSLNNILVGIGTPLNEVVFPTSVTINLSDGTSRSVGVSWGEDPNIPYNGSLDGYYPFTGVLILPVEIDNPSNLTALVYINVKSQFSITSVKPISNIEVERGTPFEEIGLPETVEVTLDYFNVESVDVNWNLGTTSYDQNQTGRYEFTGDFKLPDNMANPNNLNALVKVMVYNPIDIDYIENIDPNPDTPLNTSPGISIFEFDSKNEWILSDTAMVQIDSNNYISGTGSTNISPVAPIFNGQDYYVSALTSGDLGTRLTDMDNIEFNIYIPEKGQIEYILIKFYTDQWGSIFYENGIGDWELTSGWNKIRRSEKDFIFRDSSSGSNSMSRTKSKNSVGDNDPRAILQEKIDYMDNFLTLERERQLTESIKMRNMESTATGLASTDSWASVNRMEVFVVSKGGTPSINIDKIAINTRGKAKVLFTFDDAWLSVLEKAYPIMSQSNFKGTTWVNKEAVLGGWNDGGFMNVDDLHELHNAGWDIGNHTADHPDDESQLTEEELKETYLDNQNFIQDNGWDRGAGHVCYPSGSFSDSLINILQEIGVKTARTTVYGIEPTPVSNIYKLKCIAVGRDTDLNKYVMFEIDRAIETGSTLFFMFHRVEDEPEADDGGENYGQIAVSTDNFQRIVDYIDSLRDQIDVVTISEWYEAYMDE